jgi:hypothetical protein
MKVTPKHDLSWFIKWTASFFIMTGIILRSADTQGLYKELDLVLSLIGTLGWATVGYLWHDRALLLLNGAASITLATGLAKALI